MIFRLKDLKKALDYLRYNAHLDESAEIEVRVRNEDFENDKIGSSMTFAASQAKPPSVYDKNTTPKIITHSVEVFPTNESSPPRITMEESYTLDND